MVGRQRIPPFLELRFIQQWEYVCVWRLYLAFHGRALFVFVGMDLIIMWLHQEHGTLG